MTTHRQNNRNKINSRKWAEKFIIINKIQLSDGRKNKHLLNVINHHLKTSYTSLVNLWIDVGKNKPFSIAEKSSLKERKNNKKKQHQAYKHSDNFYSSRAWRSLRYKVLSINDGCCVLCGRSKAKHGIVLHVDHIKPRSTHPELELELSNLQILCEDCNMGKSNRDRTDWRKPRKITKKENTPTNDRQYLHAFRNGFDKNYCSGGVRKFTRAEIAKYEEEISKRILN